MTNDKIFRPNMKLIGGDNKEITEEELAPSTYTFTLQDGTVITDTGFLAVTSSFVAIMNTDDQLAVVVPMGHLRSVVRVKDAVGSA